MNSFTKKNPASVRQLMEAVRERDVYLRTSWGCEVPWAKEGTVTRDGDELVLVAHTDRDGQILECLDDEARACFQRIALDRFTTSTAVGDTPDSRCEYRAHCPDADYFSFVQGKVSIHEEEPGKEARRIRVEYVNGRKAVGYLPGHVWDGEIWKVVFDYARVLLNAQQ